MSNERTFFSTVDSLVPKDTDGIRDVYEYVDGRPQLISSGVGFKESTHKLLLGINNGLFTAGLIGVSADGSDAYFSTYDTLVPEDKNGSFLKIYDARTDGGFPYIAPPAGCEAADECVGAGSEPPTAVVKGSGATHGDTGQFSPPSTKSHRRRGQPGPHAERKRRQRRGRRRGNV